MTVATKNHTNLATLEQRVLDLECSDREHDEFINGNHKEGAKVQLAKIDQRITNIEEQRLPAIEKRLEKIEELINKAIWSIIVAVGISVLIWIITWLLPRVMAHPGIINP